MPSSSSLAFVSLLLLLVIGATISTPIVSEQEENRTNMLQNNQNASRNIFGANGENAATCYDAKIAQFINTGLSYYSHNMGQLAGYILNQIKLARYGGYWLVHAEMIAGQQQGVQWSSTATGDIFQPSSRHGCYYHDGQTYIIVLQY